jgi:O-antigen ligase
VSASESPAAPGIPKGGVLALLLFLSPFLTAVAPQLGWLTLLLVAVTAIALFILSGGAWRQLAACNTALAACLLVALYALLSVSWAADPERAIAKAGTLLVVLVAVFAASRAIAQLEAWQLRHAACALAAGAFVGALFVLIELLSEGAITRVAKNSLDIFSPTSSKRLVVSEEGRVLAITVTAFRQNVAMLVLHLWPALLALGAVAVTSYRRVFIAALVLATVVAVAFSQRQSSQLALVVSALVFALAWVSRSAASHALAIAWCLAFVVVVPASFAAYKADLHMAEWLPTSARARVIIWEYTAERVLERPLLGIGAASTRALQPKGEEAEQPPGFIYPRTTGWHAHNLFLQVWYELGAFGAVLVAFSGAWLALRIQHLPLHAQPFASASFAAPATASGFASDLWQTWLLCSVGLMVLYLLAAAYATRSRDHT